MKVLVAGIGNIFFGDDAFGVEVADRLATGTPRWGTDVRVGEYGIRGLHLAYELLDGYDALVLIDALDIGEPPGTVVVLEVDPAELATDGNPAMDGHSMNPATVLGLLAGLGGTVATVRVVGCQPAAIEDGIGLSAVVAAAVPAAVDLVVRLVDELRAAAELPG